MSAPHLLRFGTFELDHSTGELRRDGKRVPLQKQPAQVLARLVSHPGKLVRRDEFRRALWSEDTFVDFDTGLNVAINKIRRALQDSATSPRFVETLPGQGYRFVADVHAVETPTTESLISWRRATPLPAAPTPPRSVAVLPFEPLLVGGRDAALELGMTEALIVKLAQVSELRVPSLNAVQRASARDADPLATGRVLGVEAILEGTLHRSDDQLRVSARLLDVAGGTALWAQQWDLPWTGVLEVQDTIAAEVAQALAVRLASAEQASLRAHPTNAAAYEPYLRGRYLRGRGAADDRRRAIELLEEAGRLDPAAAAVQSALALAYIAVPLWEGSVGPLVEAGRLAALRALELDPGQAEAYAALGPIALYFDWDPVTSERQFRRALALEPDNIFTLQGYAELLALDGRFDEALALNARALAKDPVSVVASLARAYTLYAARRFDESVAQLQQSLELDRSSGLARVGLAKNYAAQGKAPEGIVALVDWLTAAGATPATIAALHSAANAGGLPGFWKQWLELFGSEVSDYYVARAHLSAGNREDALIWLEKAYVGKCPGIRNLGMPEWDPLRGDDRFQNLVRRAGLAVTTEPPPPPA